MARIRDPMKRVAAAILAGGSGRRLSPQKPLLEVGGRAVIERVIGALHCVDLEPLVVTNRRDDYAHLGLDMCADVLPDSGPLGGILTALQSTGAEKVLVLAADLPFVQPALVRLLLDRSEAHDCVAAEWNGRTQPLHAVYGAECSAPIRQMIEAEELCPLDLYPRIDTALISSRQIAAVDPKGLSFFNINTPEDLDRARAIASTLAAESQPTGTRR